MRLSVTLIPLCMACSDYSFKPTGEAGSGRDTALERALDDTGGPVDIVDVFEISLEIEVNKLDVAFLLDTTCSMGATANAVASEFGAIVSELDLTVSDAAYGFATFDDYNYSSMGTSADLPFILSQQMTTQRALVQSALDSVTIHNGHDLPESSMEGLYQGLTGAGYDQDGDGIYNPLTDVLPFISDPSDAFRGTTTGTMVTSTPGSGMLGGYGFREGSLPVIVYATDTYMRDPENGYDAPPFANLTAGASDVILAVNDRGARLIGISAQGDTAVPQMQYMARATDSLYAADPDGLVDDPLVLTWTGSSPAFRDTVVDAIEGMLGSITFSTVTAQLTGNVWGFDTEVSPASYSDVTVGSAPVSLDFDVTIMGEVPPSSEDQTFPMVLEIYGDGTTLLGTQDVTVVVPASF